jgi:hypothetical protein
LEQHPTMEPLAWNAQFLSPSAPHHPRKHHFKSIVPPDPLFICSLFNLISLVLLFMTSTASQEKNSVGESHLFESCFDMQLSCPLERN